MKIDISSTALEKIADSAKEFLGKLITPAIEEVGLLIKDQVTFWKFKNQIKVLNKAKEYCERHNITTKSISLKLLCPLLDNAALEDDEFLQDKWATLLANMVDSDQNIENHVFPFLLSQISSTEFKAMKKIVDEIREIGLELPLPTDVYYLRPFEVANLIRLGLLKETTDVSAKSLDGYPNVWMPGMPQPPITEVTSNIYTQITQLGIMFIEACSVKQ